MIRLIVMSFLCLLVGCGLTVSYREIRGSLGSKNTGSIEIKVKGEDLPVAKPTHIDINKNSTSAPDKEKSQSKQHMKHRGVTDTCPIEGDPIPGYTGIVPLTIKDGSVYK